MFDIAWKAFFRKERFMITYDEYNIAQAFIYS